MTKLAASFSRLKSEGAFSVLARARELEAQGRQVVHLQIGEPDFDTPANIVQAGINALNDGHTHYTPSAGILPLRQAIVDYVKRAHGLEANPDQVVVTPGAKPVVFFAILALIEPGDDVLCPGPGYPTYESMIDYVGARAVPYRLREENDFRFDPDEFRATVTPKTRLIIVNSPQNPTGGVLERSDLEVIAEVAQERDIMVLSDEIYHRLIYEGEHVSIATLPGMQERTILMDGFSKTYAMTGWRLGYGVMPEDLAQAMALLQVNSTACAADFTQVAAIEALSGPQTAVDDMLAQFRKRREVIVDGLNRLPGVSCLKPRGAFYVFPNIKQTGLSSSELASRLLEEAGVALLAGSDFGEYGDGYLRLSFANSIENIQLALESMHQFLMEL
jgi:aspartate aminotransferase